MKWTKKRVANLQNTIENVRMNANHASHVVLAVWEEWDPKEGVTQEERECLIDSLTDAKIQIEMALEELESE